MMSKKRRREPLAANVRLVETYEDLAHEDEKVRLKAAQTLVTEFILQEATTVDQLNDILRRLIRGSCSGRKAARLGYSIALTESLTVLLGHDAKEVPGLHSIVDLIDVLEQQTRVSGNVSGQEVRDHQIGRLFAVKSVIESGILFHSGDGFKSWNRILDIILDLVGKKVSLREKCGSVLLSTIQAFGSQSSEYTQILIDKVFSHGLSHTLEGAAIWIAAKTRFPALTFPEEQWSHRDPLHVESLPRLGKLLKTGGGTGSTEDKIESRDTRQEKLGPSLHFIWDVILSRLLLLESLNEKPEEHETISFAKFWNNCVDDTLFVSSPEQKYVGFSLFQRMISDVPTSLIPDLFSSNFMRCLINQLSSKERLVHRVADEAIKSMLRRAKSDSNSKLLIIEALLNSRHGDLKFVKLTKPKTLEALLSRLDFSEFPKLVALYKKLVFSPGTQDDKEAASMRLLAADQLVYTLRNVHLDSADISPGSAGAYQIQTMLTLLAHCAYFNQKALEDYPSGRPDPQIAQSSRVMFRTRLSSCLTHLLAKGKDAESFAYTTITEVYDQASDYPLEKSLLETDSSVSKVIGNAWKGLGQAKLKEIEESSSSSRRNYFRSIVLLYSLTILQVYNEEIEAVNMLEDMDYYFKERLKNDDTATESTALLGILLSYVSRPSQLFRRLAQQVFTACASDIDEKGLAAMIEILEQKENISGQEQIFEHVADEDDASDASDVEDVEMAESSSIGPVLENVDAYDPDNLSNSAYDSEQSDDELAAFEAKLAQARGTRHANQDPEVEDNTSSDEDMNDEQMEALGVDKHFEEIFQEMKKTKSKKTEKKDAMETVVNFKCRVLELLEIYVKQQHATRLALGILMPLLRAIRTTKSPMVSKSACNVVREYAQRCKGKGLPQIEDGDAYFALLEMVHAEAGIEASNDHTKACSQASLLLVRVLRTWDQGSLRGIIKLHGDLLEKFISDPRCKVKMSFFTDWLNWCNSIKQ